MSLNGHASLFLTSVSRPMGMEPAPTKSEQMAEKRVTCDRGIGKTLCLADSVRTTTALNIQRTARKPDVIMLLVRVNALR